MRTYNQCANIVIDGSEYTKGFLGLDWLPSSQAKLNEKRYEDWITYQLNLIIKKWVGWSVLSEVFSKGRSGRKMYIRQYEPTKKDPINAYAAPLDPQAATLKGAPQKYCGGDNAGKDISGTPDGTGTGTDVEIRYTPWLFTAASGGPGTNDPDEVLLHEMLHGLRQMAGVSMCGTQTKRYDTSEEFVAILVTNIYRSEAGRPNLRADHSFNSALSPALSNPANFLNQHRTDLSLMRGEQPNLFAKLQGLKHIAFNPIALF
jgi:hypothetical protein